LKSLKVGKVFQGDVIVTYKTTINKEDIIELLRIDLVDTKREMIVTLNIANNFIP
jgi:hypothetical protein